MGVEVNGRGAAAWAIVVGVASLAVAHGLGYDAWSWMVWARELLHGTLSSAGGPSLKPLPVLVAAPLTALGAVAPLAWLALQRACALLALLLAWRIAARIAGPVAGWTTTLVLAVSPDLGATALYGSAEPLLLLLVLGAVERHLHDRDRHAFVLLGVAGLIRPELWLIVPVLAIAWSRSARRLDGVVIASMALPPVIWLAVTWLGSGSPFTQFHGAPGGHYDDGLAALGGATTAIALPALLIAGIAVLNATRRRQRDVMLLAAVAIGWVLIVATMTQFGYPGTRRYFAAPAGLFALLGGVGVATLTSRLARPWTRVAPAALALAVLISALPAMRMTGRQVGVARAQDSDIAQLKDAISLAGGREAVLAFGRPAINPWRQPALAWQLNTSLAGIQATWHSTKTAPHWRPPAILFSGPSRRAGPTPARPRLWPTMNIGRAGPWSIRRAPQPSTHG